MVLPAGGNGSRRAVQHGDPALLFSPEDHSRIFKSAVFTDNEIRAKVLCVHSLLEHTDVTIMYDNEALYDICRRILGVDHVCHLYSCLDLMELSSCGPWIHLCDWVGVGFAD